MAVQLWVELIQIKNKNQNNCHTFQILFFCFVVSRSKSWDVKVFTIICYLLKYWKVFPKTLQYCVDRFCRVDFLPVKVYLKVGGLGKNRIKTRQNLLLKGSFTIRKLINKQGVKMFKQKPYIFSSRTQSSPNPETPVWSTYCRSCIISN